MKRLLITAALALTLLECCNNDINSPVLPKYNTTGKIALVILVENNDGVTGGIYEYGFINHKKETLEIFSELFNVPVKDMEKMTLNDIIETYGENWQINSIAEAGKAYYDTIISLKNEYCNEENFKTILKNLSRDKYIIDMVFCLHGGRTSFSLYNNSCDVSEFTQYLYLYDIEIRSLYQTCCYGSYVIDDWKSYGIHAVNGSSGANSITMFSPSYFIEEWTKGKTYEQAVFAAYNREIEKIQSYKSRIPVVEYILTDDNLSDSKQNAGGLNKSILWTNFPEIILF